MCQSGKVEAEGACSFCCGRKGHMQLTHSTFEVARAELSCRGNLASATAVPRETRSLSRAVPWRGLNYPYFMGIEWLLYGLVVPMHSNEKTA